MSANAPTKRHIGVDAFASWMRTNSDRLYLSAITIAEIEAGIAKALRIEATTKAEQLRRWLAAVEHFYAGRILPFGLEEARQAGQILKDSPPASVQLAAIYPHKRFQDPKVRLMIDFMAERCQRLIGRLLDEEPAAFEEATG